MNKFERRKAASSLPLLLAVEGAIVLALLALAAGNVDRIFRAFDAAELLR